MKYVSFFFFLPVSENSLPGFMPLPAGFENPYVEDLYLRMRDKNKTVHIAK